MVLACSKEAKFCCCAQDVAERPAQRSGEHRPQQVCPAPPQRTSDLSSFPVHLKRVPTGHPALTTYVPSTNVRGDGGALWLDVQAPPAEVDDTVLLAQRMMTEFEGAVSVSVSHRASAGYCLALAPIPRSFAGIWDLTMRCPPLFLQCLAPPRLVLQQDDGRAQSAHYTALTTRRPACW